MIKDFGLIHIYYGDGKGKTSMAIGQSIRSAGAGAKVLFVRFLKNNSSSELNILKQIPSIEINEIEKDFGFFFNMNEIQKKEAVSYYTHMFLQTIEKIKTNSYDLLVLDEINVATNLSLINEKLVSDFLTEKPENLEVILTGRDPSETLIDLSDYASKICKIKHPFDQGIQARQGIEF